MTSRAKKTTKMADLGKNIWSGLEAALFVGSITGEVIL